eukprot:CAMPEP_0115238454 /NCGR_PEP_ID=MMETSP0270-20121206/36890_1 /TAXON_ID=71861 /ORGANISM="Scrippsiella trochoidea, Strain CCMP3099" /LENGTH=565 /DNA_ID=CAMNT_0002653379 /DNA_START=225 /DNA_END=1922 /DNA_ORIENTATION=+
MPSSAERYLPYANANMSRIPAFMHIEVGEREITIDRDITWYEAWPRSYTNAAQSVAKFCSSVLRARLGWRTYNEPDHFLPPLCPDLTHDEMVKKCKSRNMTIGVKNHLKEAPTLTVYLTCIPVWAALRILHDWLLILNAPERYSLTIGFLSLVPQIIAFSSGFLWAIGAAEVFQSPMDGCACYYQLAPLPMFTLLATPVALYWATRDKLWKLGYAVLHGDYLFSVNYDVPFVMATNTNADPTYGYITRNSAVAVTDSYQEADERDALTSTEHHDVHRDLTMASYQFFARFSSVVGTLFEFCAAYFVYAFAFPTLTVRLYGLVVGHAHSQGGHLPHWCLVGLRIGLLVVTIICTVFSVYKQLKWFYEGFRAVQSEMNRTDKPNLSARCFMRYLGETLDLIVRGLSLYASVFSPLVAWYIWEAEPLTATNAGHIGASGFLLFVALLKSYHPSGTQRRIIDEAMRIKGGVLPMRGLRGIHTLNEEFQQLGLHGEAKCVDGFIKDEMEGNTPLENWGFGHQDDEYEKWVGCLSKQLRRQPLEGNVSKNEACSQVGETCGHVGKDASDTA